VPDVTLVDQELRPVSTGALAAAGPILLAFYLYDWTDT
jgi:peroxiredoxin